LCAVSATSKCLAQVLTTAVAAPKKRAPALCI
jgi:hypothetical protein